MLGRNEFYFAFLMYLSFRSYFINKQYCSCGYETIILNETLSKH